MCRLLASKPRSSRRVECVQHPRCYHQAWKGKLHIDADDAGVQAAACLAQELEECVGVGARRDLVLCLHPGLWRDLHGQVGQDVGMAGKDVAPLRFLVLRYERIYQAPQCLASQ